jgi:hypothetical protein
MRPILMVLALGVMALLCPARTEADGGTKPRAGGEETQTINREDLRYDGKPFSYWRTYALTELKAERRIEAVRALGTFGVSGYAEEATRVLVELVKRYPEREFIFPEAKQDYSPDQQVLQAAHEAVEKMGEPAVSVLLEDWKHPSARRFAEGVLCNPFKECITASAVPKLVTLAHTGELESRELAVRILFLHIAFVGKATEPIKRALLASLAQNDSVKQFLPSVLAMLKEDRPDEVRTSAVGVLVVLQPYAQTIVPAFVTILKDVVKTRQKEVGELKKQKSSSVPLPHPTMYWAPPPPPPPPPTPSEAVVSGQWIINAVSSFGPAAREAIPILEKFLQDPELRDAAVQAIQAIRQEPKEK